MRSEDGETKDRRSADINRKKDKILMQANNWYSLRDNLSFSSSAQRNRPQYGLWTESGNGHEGCLMTDTIDSEAMT